MHNTTTPPTDIAIIGAGPLGLSLALALKQHGRQVQLFDARKDQAAHQDKRVLALSHGSRQILEKLGAWPAQKVTPIHTIHISQRGALGRTQMHAHDYGIPALGYVVPAAQLMHQLTQSAHAAGIETLFDARVTHTSTQAQSATLHIAHTDQRTSTARAQLIACCEGAITQDTHDILQHDYQQSALLCRVSTRHPHQHTAFERFTPDGPIALLPLENDYAVVWIVSAERLQTLLSMTETELLAQLQQAFGQRVQLTTLTDRASYPLALRFRKHPTSTRTVWLGNAAQTLHPVAGQGLNLALRDAWALTQTLRETPDAGDTHALRRYAKARQTDRLSTIGFSDAIVRAFSNDNLLLQHSRGAALLAMEALPTVRHFIAKRMIFGARAWP